MAGYDKVDTKTYQERVYEISRMLRRKPTSYILEYIVNTYGVEQTQAYNYIKDAKEEWKKYFEKLKGDGIAYHIAQIRDLKDQAYSKKVVIGTVDNKQIVNIADLGLILEITKEEAKLMGIYPSEKHKIEVEEVGELANAKGKLIKRINDLVDKRGKGKDIKQPD